MSDYESRLAEAALPSRSNYESATAQQIQQMEDMVNQLESGYTGMMGGGANSAPGATSYAAPQDPAPVMEPGADPGVTPQQVEAEMRRRGLLQ